MDDLYQDEKEKTKKQRDATAAYREQLCGALREMAGTRDGIEFLRWLVTFCGTLQATYPQDYARAAWDAGRRAIGIEIMSLARKAGVLEHIIREKAKHG